MSNFLLAFGPDTVHFASKIMRMLAMNKEKPTGRAKGGQARAEVLPPERRSEIAKNAAAARWHGPQPILADYGAPDRPLRIGGIEIPCYVLADGRRVLAQRGLQSGIGMSEGGGRGGARKIVQFLESLDKKGLDTRDLIARASNPIRFKPRHGGNTADGYEAEILVDLCAVIINADRKGKLLASQKHFADQAAVLQHGWATVGIIALVDEATGYQDYRRKDALALILERFVVKELRPYIRTFPTEFYRQIYRLNNWDYIEGCGRPGVIGHWTNNIVYKRLAPGVWEELKKRTQRSVAGNLKNKLFHRLTDDVGHPKLKEHLAAVVMLMKYSPDWRVFMERLDKEFPQWGKTLLLPFPDDYEDWREED